MKKKVKKELKAYRKFKESYKFKEREFKRDGEDLYCMGELVCHADEKAVGECDKWINAGYKLSGATSKAISNLFPYKIKFRGKKLASLEAFFQGIKFKDKKMQKLVFKYSGVDANNIKIASDIDWKAGGIVYWRGKPIKRDSQEYDEMIEELYICAIQNPLYRNVLKKIDKPIIHSIGVKDKAETVFTKHEFEYMLNSLVAFLHD